MNVGQLLFALRDAVNYMESKGLLRTDGVILLNNVSADVGLVSVIETSLKEHGINIPGEVDKVLAILPLILSIAGVK